MPQFRVASRRGDGVSDDIEQQSADAIEAKIKPRLRRVICPYCDNTVWFVLDGSMTPSAVLLTPRPLRAYSLACTNCGFVRQHIRAIVDGEVSGEVVYATVNH